MSLWYTVNSVSFIIHGQVVECPTTDLKVVGWNHGCTNIVFHNPTQQHEYCSICHQEAIIESDLPKL